jgi:hypothetical protein
VATIQIRDIPEDAYQTLRRRAKEAGQSLQGYLRQHLIEFGNTPTKAEAIAEIEAMLARHGGTTATLEQLRADVEADSR